MYDHKLLIMCRILSLMVRVDRSGSDEGTTEALRDKLKKKQKHFAFVLSSTCNF